MVGRVYLIGKDALQWCYTKACPQKMTVKLRQALVAGIYVSAIACAGYVAKYFAAGWCLRKFYINNVCKVSLVFGARAPGCRRVIATLVIITTYQVYVFQFKFAVFRLSRIQCRSGLRETRYHLKINCNNCQA